MPRRALLVEDDSSIATVITAALEDEAFTVHRCDSIAGATGCSPTDPTT